MNINNSQSLESIWEALLSRDPEIICGAMDRVNTDEKKQIIGHLQKMVGEPGWHEEQRKSARTALDVILHD